MRALPSKAFARSAEGGPWAHFPWLRGPSFWVDLQAEHFWVLLLTSFSKTGLNVTRKAPFPKSPLASVSAPCLHGGEHQAGEGTLPGMTWVTLAAAWLPSHTPDLLFLLPHRTPRGHWERQSDIGDII